MTTTDSITRSIEIEAELGIVWDLVTEPGWWVPSDSDEIGDRNPGAVTVRESADIGRYPVQVVELRPMSYAAFRWASQFAGQDLAPGRTTLIEFTLAERAGRVVLTVLESGFAALETTARNKAAGIEENSGGWTEELASLAERAHAA